jgi:hypothetical protein
MVEISVRSYLMAGVALTAAGAVAFTPLVVPVASPRAIPVPHVTPPRVDLARLSHRPISRRWSATSTLPRILYRPRWAPRLACRGRRWSAVSIPLRQ